MAAYRTAVTIVLIFMLVVSCASRTKGVYHLVKEHETLRSIARAYKTDINVIARANRLRASSTLEAGKVLFIPGARDVREAAAVAAPDEEKPPSPPPRTAVVSRPRDAGVERKTEPPIKTSLRFLWPAKGAVISRFGVQDTGSKNTGIKIAAPEGTQVISSESGAVIHAGPIKYFGNMVIIRHAGGFSTVYAHLKDISCRNGDVVARGSPIAAVGTDEKTATACLHFEIRYKNSARNPLEYLPRVR